VLVRKDKFECKDFVLASMFLHPMVPLSSSEANKEGRQAANIPFADA
jgi:hypothetical protein